MFNFICYFFTLISILFIIDAISESFPVICTVLFIAMMCLWIPKFNKSIIENKFHDNKFLYFIVALIVSLILIGTSIHIGMSDRELPDYSKTETQETETPKEQTETKKASEDLTWFAKFQCEKEIKARATYPPSVKVKFRDDHYIEGNSYTVYGTVDSQNAFGAMVRQNFGCEIILDQENDKFWVKDLLIE